MKLRNACIRNFRCIDNSTEFSIADVTCLVGKNESGKTSVLHALEKIAPLDPKTTKPEKLRDYPRHKLTDFNESDEIVVTTWDLDSTDVAAVEQVLGPGTLKTNRVELRKSYKTAMSCLADLDINKVIGWILTESACDPAERAELESCEDTRELKRKAELLKPQGSARVLAVLDRVGKFRDADAQNAATDIIIKRLPKFMYFSSFDRMPGNIHLETLEREVASGAVSRPSEVVLAFLEYAGTSIAELKKLDTYEAIKARVEAASIKISRQIFEYWTQNRHLKVEFTVEPGRSGDSAPFNSGTVMRVRIHNKLHDMTVPFDDRSAGFTWFFSFLVLFSQVERKFGNVVILMDEPGLNLHGRAQGDLVRFIYEKLRPKHQVLYTTHSPFMVPSEDITAVRTVEDVITWKNDGSGSFDVHGTKVGDEVLSLDRDTLFPLQGALGYEVTQSLFIGKHTLIVEGPSDILYLQALSGELRRRQREGLDRRWTLCPSGGIDKVAAFVSLFGGNILHIAVLTDYAHGSKAKVEALRRNKILQDGHVLTMAQFCSKDEAEVEDLFSDELNIALVNQTNGLTGKAALTAKHLASSGESSPRVVQRVAAAMRLLATAPDYDHYEPSLWLIQNPSYFAADTAAGNELLDRSEALIKMVNALLPKL